MENSPDLKGDVLWSLAEITFIVFHLLELRHLNNYLWHKHPFVFDLGVRMDLDVHILLRNLYSCMTRGEKVVRCSSVWESSAGEEGL